MSNELSIAACTATLRSILERAFRDGGSETEVTTLPLDLASQPQEARRLNLFLYHMMPNAAWRNQPIPERGIRSNPPLALNLYYLLTAYGNEKVEEDDHKILGRAMTVLHENTVLSPDRIRNAIDFSAASDPVRARDLRDSDLHEQVEKIRLTPEPLSLDEMMKLWGTFHQSPYRISAAYQASVVLLEGRLKPPAPFPVLARGSEDDIGPLLQSGLAPALLSIEYRDARSQSPPLPSASLGDVFTVYGTNLPVRGARLLLIDPKKKTVTDNPEANVVSELEILSGSSDSRILSRLNTSDDIACGRLALVLKSISAAGRTQTTTPIQIDIAPRLVMDNDDNSVLSAYKSQNENRHLLTVTCRPRPAIRRDVLLLLTPVDNGPAPPPIIGVTFDKRPLTLEQAGDESPIQKLARTLSSPDEVVFDTSSVRPGSYRIRVRVDLVDSVPLRRRGETLVFDSRQELTL